tara:strand:+ start:2567 stop:2740 length:174 start_codon:yes stop_codon:yes gene_type:complete
VHVLQPRGVGKRLGYSDDELDAAAIDKVESMLRAENASLKAELAAERELRREAEHRA